MRERLAGDGERLCESQYKDIFSKDVDKERSRDNVEFCHEDIKAVYHELFDEALERYNAKQKRSDPGRLKTIMRKSGRGSRRNCFTK